MKLKKYSDEYFEPMVKFIHQAFPQRKHASEYINYLFHVLANKSDMSIVVNDDDEIIATNFYLRTKALINNIQEEVMWSFDTMVLNEYRKSDAGTMITVEYIGNNNLWGVGLSSIAVKAHKIIKSKFIGYLPSSLKVNVLSPYSLGLFVKMPVLRNKVKTISIQSISCGKYNFMKVQNAEDIVKNKPYWNSNTVEFIRDTNFINNRILYHGNTYAIYTAPSLCADSNNIYFAVRVQDYKYTKILHIVDYRCNLQNRQEFNAIIEASSKIARKYKLAGVQIKSSIEGINKFLNRKGFITKRPGSVMVTRNKNVTEDVFITSVDSDQGLGFISN